MARYLRESDVYNLLGERGMATVHCSQIDVLPRADVAPRAEVAREIFEEIEKIFERLKKRERSNAVCTWCVHANAYGQRHEECDKLYIDKNGKEQYGCCVYAKFESLIDKELAELRKKYLEEEKK